MIDQQLGKCPIWQTDALHLPTDKQGARVESARAGGRYFITGSAATTITNTDELVRARLTTWLIGQRLQGIGEPEVSTYKIDEARAARSMPLMSRTDRLLKFFALRSTQVGLRLRMLPRSELYLESAAWSESTTVDEVNFLTEVMAEKGWIKLGVFVGGRDVTVLAEGYVHLDEISQIFSTSTQGFVAMWFDPSLEAAYVQGIAPAIKDSGYAPTRIDLKIHNNKIDDEIVAEIRRSRFLVADFTHGDDGARGGVYYEAGFAHGLGIPVIFTCREDMIAKAHFDTRQYNHIVWKDAADLRVRLANRISATLGDGPNSATGN